MGAVREGPKFRTFSSPDTLVVFSNALGHSWNCGGLCAFSSLKLSSQHTYGVLWTSREVTAARLKLEMSVFRLARRHQPLDVGTTVFAHQLGEFRLYGASYNISDYYWTNNNNSKTFSAATIQATATTYYCAKRSEREVDAF